MRRHVVLGLLTLGGLVTACRRSPDVEAPPPPVVDDPVDSLSVLSPSSIESEVRYDLGSALQAMEQAVPRRFGDINSRLDVETNPRAHFAFAASRAPFRIEFDGKRATISTTVEYEGRGWYNPRIGPEVSAACGTGGVPRPRVRVRIVSDLALSPEWSLASRSRVASVAPVTGEDRDRCRVTVFRIDVTDRVVGATRKVLEGQLKNLDRAIARVQTRARFESWWRALAKPIQLTDSVWFTINPLDVKLGEVRNDSGALVAALELTATPRIQTGNRPNEFDLITPLPVLKRGAFGGRAMRVSLDGQLGYDVATTMLRRSLVQKRIERGERHFIIEDVTLSGIGAGRVALGVRFGGSMSGRVYLTGTPRYDAAMDQLLVPDLDFDLRSSSTLVRSLAWLKDDAIVGFLRERARFPVQGQLDRLRELAERGMNRELTSGVRLVGRLDKASTVAVRAFRDALRVRAEATGDAHLEIDRPIAVPGADKGGL